MSSETTDLTVFLQKQLNIDATRSIQWHDLECSIHAHLKGGLLAVVAASRMMDEVPGAVCSCDGPGRVLQEIEMKRGVVARYEFACHEAAALDIDEEEREKRIASAAAFQSCALLIAATYSRRDGYADAIASVG